MWIRVLVRFEYVRGDYSGIQLVVGGRHDEFLWKHRP